MRHLPPGVSHMSARSFAPHLFVILALGAALLAVALARVAREKPAPGVLAVGSEVTVTLPTGEFAGRGDMKQEVRRTVGLRVKRVGPAGGPPLGAGVWTFEVEGVRYWAVPAE